MSLLTLKLAIKIFEFLFNQSFRKKQGFASLVNSIVVFKRFARNLKKINDRAFRESTKEIQEIILKASIKVHNDKIKRMFVKIGHDDHFVNNCFVGPIKDLLLPNLLLNRTKNHLKNNKLRELVLVKKINFLSIPSAEIDTVPFSPIMLESPLDPFPPAMEGFETLDNLPKICSDDGVDFDFLNFFESQTINEGDNYYMRCCGDNVKQTTCCCRSFHTRTIERDLDHSCKYGGNESGAKKILRQNDKEDKIKMQISVLRQCNLNKNLDWFKEFSMYNVICKRFIGKLRNLVLKKKDERAAFKKSFNSFMECGVEYDINDLLKSKLEQLSKHECKPIQVGKFIPTELAMTIFDMSLECQYCLYYPTRLYDVFKCICFEACDNRKHCALGLLAQNTNLTNGRERLTNTSVRTCSHCKNEIFTCVGKGKDNKCRRCSSSRNLIDTELYRQKLWNSWLSVTLSKNQITRTSCPVCEEMEESIFNYEALINYQSGCKVVVKHKTLFKGPKKESDELLVWCMGKFVKAFCLYDDSCMPLGSEFDPVNPQIQESVEEMPFTAPNSTIPSLEQNPFASMKKMLSTSILISMGRLSCDEIVNNIIRFICCPCCDKVDSAAYCDTSFCICHENCLHPQCRFETSFSFSKEEEVREIEFEIKVLSDQKTLAAKEAESHAQNHDLVELIVLTPAQRRRAKKVDSAFNKSGLISPCPCTWMGKVDPDFLCYALQKLDATNSLHLVMFLRHNLDICNFLGADYHGNIPKIIGGVNRCGHGVDMELQSLYKETDKETNPNCEVCQDLRFETKSLEKKIERLLDLSEKIQLYIKAETMTKRSISCRSDIESALLPIFEMREGLTIHASLKFANDVTSDFLKYESNNNPSIPYVYRPIDKFRNAVYTIIRYVVQGGGKIEEYLLPKKVEDLFEQTLSDEFGHTSSDGDYVGGGSALESAMENKKTENSTRDLMQDFQEAERVPDSKEVKKGINFKGDGVTGIKECVYCNGKSWRKENCNCQFNCSVNCISKLKKIGPMERIKKRGFKLPQVDVGMIETLAERTRREDRFFFEFNFPGQEHVCVPLPTGPCAIEACRTFGLCPCKWFKHFGKERYDKGWFTFPEMLELIPNLVAQTPDNIKLNVVQSTFDGWMHDAKVISFSGDIDQGHWYNARYEDVATMTDAEKQEIIRNHEISRRKSMMFLAIAVHKFLNIAKTFREALVMSKSEDQGEENLYEDVLDELLQDIADEDWDFDLEVIKNIPPDDLIKICDEGTDYDKIMQYLKSNNLVGECQADTDTGYSTQQLVEKCLENMRDRQTWIKWFNMMDESQKEIYFKAKDKHVLAELEVSNALDKIGGKTKVLMIEFREITQQEGYTELDWLEFVNEDYAIEFKDFYKNNTAKDQEDESHSEYELASEVDEVDYDEALQEYLCEAEDEGWQLDLDKIKNIPQDDLLELYSSGVDLDNLLEYLKSHDESTNEAKIENVDPPRNLDHVVDEEPLFDSKIDSEDPFVFSKKGEIQQFDEIEQRNADNLGCCFTTYIGDQFLLIKLPNLYHDSVGREVTALNLSCFTKMYDELNFAIGRHSDDFFSSVYSKDETETFIESVSSYFKFRHDLFASIAGNYLSKIHTNYFGTDTEINSIFPGVSEKNRTPDIIVVEGKKVLVVEVSVTSDYRKSNLQKGTDTSNSKYKEEIDNITKLGHVVVYINFYLDMSTGLDNIADFLTLCKAEGFKLNEAYGNSYSNLVRDCLFKNRSSEKLGYLMFQIGSVKWNEEIKETSSITLDIFKTRVGAKNTKRVRIEKRKMNRNSIEMIKLNMSSITNNLYSPRFDRGKVVLRVTKRDVTIWKSDDGLEASKLLTLLQEGRYWDLRMFIKVFSPIGQGWVDSDKQLPFISVPISSPHNEKLIEKNDHTHSIGSSDYTCKGAMYSMRENMEIDFIPFTHYLDARQKNLSNLLSNKSVNPSTVKDAQDKYIENCDKIQSEIDKHNPKNIFTLPFCDAAVMSREDKKLSEFMFEETATYRVLYCKFRDEPQKLIRNTIKPEFTDKLRQLNKEYRIINSSVAQAFGESRVNKKFIKKFFLGGEKVLETETQKKVYNEFNSRIGQLNKETQDVNIEMKKSMVKTKVNFVKLNKIDLQSIKSEYDWLNKDRANVDRNFKRENGLKNHKLIFDDLLNCLFMTQANVDYSGYFESILSPGKDTSPMIKLKEMTMSYFKRCSLEIKNLNVVLMSDFVSNFCYTLLHFSRIQGGNDRFYYSNLGWKNCNLFVRGGKSINQTGDSRQFRLSYPIPKVLYDNRDILYSNSSRFCRRESEYYILTPWMNLHEKVLADMVNCKEKVVMNLMTYQNRVTLENNTFHWKNIGFNILLMFNNRRQTEEMLSDLRYPIVNCMGEMSDIVALYGSLANKYSDFIQFFVGESLRSYLKFFSELDVKNNKSFDKGHHLFTKEKLLGITDLTFLIYCTYMMTKAPYKQHIEQAKNLKGITAIHEDFLEVVGGESKPSLSKVLESTETDNPDKIFENDFYFSPKFSFELGKELSDFLIEKNDVSDINNSFYNNFTKGWYNIENESGLRSNTFEKNTEDSFFGRKSHEVVAKFMMDELCKGVKISEILNGIKDSNLDVFKKSKELSKYDISFCEMINSDSTNKKMRFHVVDKTQWKGSREIYVMTINTKIHQNPLEGFFRDICKKVDNEIISVPSSRRSALIHGQLYDNKYIRNAEENFVRYNITLDCRKWGPKTNFNKYLYFMMGCNDIMPSEFIEYFSYFTKLYNEKDVVLSPNAASVFLKNERFQSKECLFDKVDELKTYKFTMPYSFVMGIFNYLSSLYHAMAQKSAIEKITKHIWDKYEVPIIIRMNSHSDDSGGYVLIPRNSKGGSRADEGIILREVISLYETILKFGNMMLSLKKCTVSKQYFELLSVLYINDKLLPMVPKFYGNMSMKPTMSGYSQDMSQGYSKTIELMQNGATFAEAYLGMRIMSVLYRSMYHLTNDDDDRPVSAYGGLYSHPLIVLLTGSKSDNIRLFKYDKDKFFRFQAAMMCLTGEERESFKQQGIKPKPYSIIRRSVKDLTNKYKTLYDNWILPSVSDIMYSEKTNPESYWDMSYNSSLTSSPWQLEGSADNGLVFKKLNEEFKLNLSVPEELQITKDCVIKNNLIRPLCLINNQFKDTEFLNSLAYVGLTRRITNLISTAAEQNIETNLGFISQKYIPKLIEGLQASNLVGEEFSQIRFDMKHFAEYKEKLEPIFKDILGDADTVYDYINDSVLINTVVEKNLKSQQVTAKPCHLQLLLDPNSFLVKTDPERIYYSGTGCEWIFEETKSYSKDKNFIKEKLSSCGFEPTDHGLFIHYVRNMEKNHEKDFSLYAYVDAKNREIQDVEGVVGLLESNSVYGHRIVKMFKNLKLSTKLKSFNVALTEQISYLLKITKFYLHLCKQNYKNNARIKGIEIPNEIKKTPFGRIFFPSKTNSFSDCNYYYGWTQTQKYVNGKWTGSGKLIFKANDAIFELLINKNILEHVYVNTNPLLLPSTTDFVMMIYLVVSLNIKMYNRLSTYRDNFVICPSEGLRISHEYATDFHYCRIERDDGLNRYLEKVPKHLTTGRFMLNSVKFIHIAYEEPFSTDIEGLTGLPELLAKKDDDTKSVENFTDLLGKFSKSDLYEFCIKNKPMMGYDFLAVLKESCEARGVKFNQLTLEKLEQIIDSRIDTTMLPNEVYWAVKNSESLFRIRGCYSDFVNDLTEELSKDEEDQNWSTIISKWGPSAKAEMGRVAKRTFNPEILNNPYILLDFDCLSLLDCLESAIVSIFNDGFNFLTTSPDWGVFSQFMQWDDSTIKKVLYLVRRESNVNQYHSNLHSVSKISEFLNFVYGEIFDNDVFFKQFNSKIQGHMIGSSMLCDAKNSKSWAVVHYVCCKKLGGIKDPHIPIDKYNSYEKSAREIDSNSTTYLSKNTKFGNVNMFLQNYRKRVPHQYTKTYTVKDEKGNNLKKTKNQVCYYQFYKSDKIPNIYSTPNFKYLLQEKDDKLASETKDLYKRDRGGHLNTLNALLKLVPENFREVINSYQELKHNEIFDIPVVEVIGSVCIGQLASYYQHCLLICTSLPSDILEFSDKIRVYNGSFYLQNDLVTGLCYYISYNIDIPLWGLNRIDFTKNDAINDIYFEKSLNNYIEYRDSPHKFSRKGVEEIHKLHQHDCDEEKNDYEHNNLFIDCYLSVIHGTSGFNDESDDYKELFKKLDLLEGDSSNNILAHYLLTNYYNGLLKSKHGTEMEGMLNACLQDVLNYKPLAEMGNIGSLLNEKDDTRRFDSFSTNGYSPIDRNTTIYQNLRLIFGENVDKVLNRNIELQQSDRNFLNFEIEKSIALYDKMYNKHCFTPYEHKAMRNVLRWLRAVITNCDLVEMSMPDDKTCIANFLSSLTNEMFLKVKNPDEFFSDTDSEDDYDMTEEDRRWRPEDVKKLDVDAYVKKYGKQPGVSNI